MTKRIYFSDENDFRTKVNKVNSIKNEHPFVINQINRKGTDYFEVSVTQKLTVTTDEMIENYFNHLESLF